MLRLLALAVFVAAQALAAEVKVLSAVGMRQVMLELGSKFEHLKGHRLTISFDSSGEIVKRIQAGETVDVVIIPPAGVKRLNGKIVIGSTSDLATSRVGVAVRKGSPKLDISTSEAFKRAMLNAKHIACPDPALGGSSGVHIARVFERLGIVEALRSKLVLASAPGEATAMPGHLLAEGNCSPPDARTHGGEGHRDHWPAAG